LFSKIIKEIIIDEYINNNANQPNERNMVKGLKGDWEGKLTTKELYTLFPKGPAKRIENEVLEEGIKIQGGTFQQPKGMIESHHDHRISMSFAVASLRCKGPAKQAGKIAGLPETKRKGGY
jgi:sulfur relay (sulfurtransferase) DsrC/TusE family protein